MSVRGEKEVFYIAVKKKKERDVETVEFAMREWKLKFIVCSPIGTSK